MSAFETMAKHLNGQGIPTTIVEAADTAREPIFITVSYQGKNAKLQYTPAQSDSIQTGTDVLNLLKQHLRKAELITDPS